MSEKAAPTSHNVNIAPTFMPFRGPFSRWPRFTEAFLAAIVFLLSALVSSESNDNEVIFRAFTDVPVVVAILLAGAAGSLYWRRSHPLGVLATTLVLMALSNALGYSYDFFGVPVVLYSVGRYENNDRLSQFGGATIGLVGLMMLFDNNTLPDIGFSFFVLFFSWYLGRRIRARGEYLRLLQERAEQLEKEKANESQRAIAAERARIARELHDLVAHQVSLMTVQAAAAKTVAESNPSKAIQAMEAVENAGRQALVELRHLLGLIRSEDDDGQLKPQPRLADVQQLIDSFRSAGLSVSFSVNTLQSPLPAGIDLAIYRIVQESLTNVIKHAGDDVAAEVKIVIDQHSVNIEIDDDGETKVTGKLEDPGYGIIGMRERAILLGGSLEAMVCKNGGYKVRCRIPIE